jgi:hypothetical protein
MQRPFYRARILQRIGRVILEDFLPTLESKRCA